MSFRSHESRVFEPTDGQRTFLVLPSGPEMLGSVLQRPCQSVGVGHLPTPLTVAKCGPHLAAKE